MAQTVKIGGATYENVPAIQTTDGAGHTGSFVDTSDGTAAAGEILNGKTAYAAGAKVTGTMTNRGAVSGTISTKDGQYTVPAGYHNGSGKVQISASEQAKIVEGNIKSGVTILGQAGKASVVDTGDANAGAGDIASGKTAYVNGSKVTGTFVPTPSGYQVQTGSLVYTSTSNTNITVTGLPFKPVGAIVLKQNKARTSGNLLCVASESIYNDGDSDIYGINQTTGTSTALVASALPLVMDANGFHRHPSSTTYKTYGYYLYVAWGN